MKRVNILWIDDKNKDKEINIIKKSVKNLQIGWKHPNSIQVMTPSELEQIDLVLVDFKLNQKPDSENNTFQGFGLTMGSMIRERNQLIPIYVISNVFKEYPELKKFCRDNFEKTFDGLKEILENPKQLNQDALDYRQLRSTDPDDISKVLDILKVPNTVRDRLSKAIPPSAISKVQSKPYRIFELTKWIRRTFLQLPGALYNKDFLAAYLGLSPSGFNKIKDVFSKASYNGIFAKESNQELWWVEEVNRFLLSNKNKNMTTETNIPKIVKAIFKNLKQKDFAVCSVCRQAYPDTWARKEDTKDVYRNAHFSCTIRDIQRETVAFFDEPRLVK